MPYPRAVQCMSRFYVTALLGLAISVAVAAHGSVAAADPNQPAAAAFTSAKTSKERLSDKASDEQRVDDCKVPQARRTRPRPTACQGGTAEH
jgi:hypothetical protein